MGPNEAETIARNILASHSKSDDSGRVPGQEVLALGLDIPGLGLLEFMEASLEQAAAALG